MRVSTENLMTTSEFYDNTMIGEIEIGEVMLLEAIDDDYEFIDYVVGIADCWPLAVTKETGSLHSVSSIEGLEGVPKDSINKAINMALEHELELSDFFKSYDRR